MKEAIVLKTSDPAPARSEPPNVTYRPVTQQEGFAPRLAESKRERRPDTALELTAQSKQAVSVDV